MFPLTPDQHHWLEVATEDEGWCSFTSCTPSRSRARTDRFTETAVVCSYRRLDITYLSNAFDAVNHSSLMFTALASNLQLNINSLVTPHKHDKTKPSSTVRDWPRRVSRAYHRRVYSPASRNRRTSLIFNHRTSAYLRIISNAEFQLGVGTQVSGWRLIVTMIFSSKAS